MMNHGCWAQLDLRKRKFDGPYDNQLVVLRFVPKDGVRSVSERYEVGHFTTEDGKSWFLGNYGSCDDVTRARKKYDIWWTPLPRI